MDCKRSSTDEESASSMKSELFAIAIAAIAAIATLSACSGGTPGTYQGYVEGEFVHVGSGVAGRLERLVVQRGQNVEANAPLFELESMQEDAAVKQAEEALAAAEAQLADMGTGRRTAEVDVVRAQLEQATAAERQSASQLTRDTASLEAGGISRMQLEASRAKHDVDAARVRELRGQLEVAELSGRPEQIRAQESQVAAARAAAEQTRWRLEQTQMTAPQGGVIVDTLFRDGEWVPAGSPVVRMLPPGNVKVRFFVPQPELSLVPIGQRVRILCDGCTPAEVVATVSYLATEPEFTPPIIYSNETRSKLVYMVEARPEPQDGLSLRPGQPVEVIVQ
jgi:HlyD family secretion protein